MTETVETKLKPICMAVTTRVEGGYMASVYNTFTFPDGRLLYEKVAETASPIEDVEILHEELVANFPDLGAPVEVENADS